MPFAFLIVGSVLVISGVRATSSQLLTLVKGDLLGKNGYLYWMVVILAIGAVGYVPPLRNLSRAFLILVLIVLILKQGTGFFSMFTSSLNKISGSTSTLGASTQLANTSSTLMGQYTNVF